MPFAGQKNFVRRSKYAFSDTTVKVQERENEVWPILQHFQ